MLDPSRVRGFLDVFGAWDPTLAFVLAGAVIVATIGFRLVGRRATPLLAPRFDLPAARHVDAPLVAGAALFGIGWAISCYCPGPAVASLTFAGAPAIVFVAAMLIGMLAFEAWRRRPAAKPEPSIRPACRWPMPLTSSIPRCWSCATFSPGLPTR
jgi:uncharacterized protein